MAGLSRGLSPQGPRLSRAEGSDPLSLQPNEAP